MKMRTGRPGWARALTASEAARAMNRGHFFATEYVADILESIGELEPRSRSFVEIYREEAMECAQKCDERHGRQAGRPLEGVVFAVKDSIDVLGRRTGAGSRSTCTHPVPTADAEVVSRLRAAGAILVGKLALEELGIGPTTKDSAVPAPRNPWHPGRSAGGSSSGCGVAVASGLVPIAIGSDTAGSIRLPAAHCGVVGLKPSYGLVNSLGVLPLAPSLDHVGIVTRDVPDAAQVLRLVVDDPPTEQLRGRPLAGTRVGVVHIERDVAGMLDDEVSSAFARTVVGMRARGALTDRVDLAPLETFQRCGATILHAEAYQGFRGLLMKHGDEMHPSTSRRLASGAGVSAANLARARQTQLDLTRAFDRTMAGFDVLATITTLAPPGPAVDMELSDDESMTLSPRMPFNVVGAPVLALPIGLTSDNMPISMQLIGARGDDWGLLRVAKAWQREVGGGPVRRQAARADGCWRG